MDLSVDDMCEIWSIVDNIRGLRGGVNVKGACHGERGKCECRVDIQDSVEGDVVCSECGIIKQERVLLAQDHFDSNDNRIMQESSKDEFFENKQLSTRISKNWRCKRPASALMHKLQLHGSINQKQMYRYREFADIERICELLQTTLTVANSSKHYFNNLCKIKTFRGANRLAMKGCAIMRSLKDNKVSRDVSEMLKACNVTKKVLTRNIKVYEEMTDCKLLQENRCLEVYRYLQRLGVQYSDVFKLSSQIVKRREQCMKEREYQGKSPRVVYALILKDLGYGKKSICDALHVSLTAF